MQSKQPSDQQNQLNNGDQQQNQQQISNSQEAQEAQDTQDIEQQINDTDSNYDDTQSTQQLIQNSDDEEYKEYEEYEEEKKQQSDQEDDTEKQKNNKASKKKPQQMQNQEEQEFIGNFNNININQKTKPSSYALIQTMGAHTVKSDKEAIGDDSYAKRLDQYFTGYLGQNLYKWIKPKEGPILKDNEKWGFNKETSKATFYQSFEKQFEDFINLPENNADIIILNWHMRFGSVGSIGGTSIPSGHTGNGLTSEYFKKLQNITTNQNKILKLICTVHESQQFENSTKNILQYIDAIITVNEDVKLKIKELYQRPTYSSVVPDLMYNRLTILADNFLTNIMNNDNLNNDDLNIVGALYLNILRNKFINIVYKCDIQYLKYDTLQLPYHLFSYNKIEYKNLFNQYLEIQEKESATYTQNINNENTKWLHEIKSGIVIFGIAGRHDVTLLRIKYLCGAFIAAKNNKQINDNFKIVLAGENEYEAMKQQNLKTIDDQLSEKLKAKIEADNKEISENNKIIEEYQEIKSQQDKIKIIVTNRITSLESLSNCKYAISFDANGYRENASSMINLIRSGFALFEKKHFNLTKGDEKKYKDLISNKDKEFINEVAKKIIAMEHDDNMFFQWLVQQQPRYKQHALSKVGDGLVKVFDNIAFTSQESILKQLFKLFPQNQSQSQNQSINENHSSIPGFAQEFLNSNHQYTNDDLDLILALRFSTLQGDVQQNTIFTPTIGGANNIEAHIQEIINNNDRIQKALNDNSLLNVLIPINIGNYHYIGLNININNSDINNGDITLNFMDSLNNIPQELIKLAESIRNAIAEKLNRNVTSNIRKVPKQDENNCGPETIENLIDSVSSHSRYDSNFIREGHLFLLLDAGIEFKQNQNEILQGKRQNIKGLTIKKNVEYDVSFEKILKCSLSNESLSDEVRKLSSKFCAQFKIDNNHKIHDKNQKTNNQEDTFNATNQSQDYRDLLGVHHERTVTITGQILDEKIIAQIQYFLEEGIVFQTLRDAMNNARVVVTGETVDNNDDQQKDQQKDQEDQLSTSELDWTNSEQLFYNLLEFAKQYIFLEDVNFGSTY